MDPNTATPSLPPQSPNDPDPGPIQQPRKRRRLSASQATQSAPPLRAEFIRLIEVLNALGELCAVGTIDLTMPRRGMAGIEAADGWLWLETAAKKHKGQSAEVWLEALIDRGYVRATYIMTSATRARARVYVLPEDIGKGLLPEMDYTHRNMLKRLARCLDASAQAWKGVPVDAPEKLTFKAGLMEIVSPTNDIYYFDAKDVKFFKNSTYPETERRKRYNLRRGN